MTLSINHRSHRESLYVIRVSRKIYNTIAGVHECLLEVFRLSIKDKGLVTLPFPSHGLGLVALRGRNADANAPRDEISFIQYDVEKEQGECAKPAVEKRVVPR